jgi:hypothetical protein
MQIRTITLATSFVVAPAAFTASLAEDTAVNEQTFDWIFFAIVGLPLVIALVELLVPALSDRLIRSRNRSGD